MGGRISRKFSVTFINTWKTWLTSGTGHAFYPPYMHVIHLLRKAGIDKKIPLKFSQKSTLTFPQFPFVNPCKCFNYKQGGYTIRMYIFFSWPKLLIWCSILQRCTISIFRYRFNINYSISLLINTNINFNYSKEGLTISIPYQFFNKFPYQFQYQSLH